MAFKYDRSFHQRFPATAGLLVANVLLFVVCLVLQRGFPPRAGGGFRLLPVDGLVLHLLGWNALDSVRDGEFWRLLTSCFLHGDAIHLLFNMSVLISLGAAAEWLYGTWRFLAVYVWTGIAGSAASLAWRWSQAEAPASVGSSGAIFGILGLLLGSVWRERGRAGSMERDALVRWAVVALLFGVLVGADNAAHAGGLAAGVFLGRFLEHRADPRASSRVWRAAGMASVVLCVAAFAAQVPVYRRFAQLWPELRRFDGDLVVLREALLHLEGEGEWPREMLLDRLNSEADEPAASLFAEARALVERTKPGKAADPADVRAFERRVEAWANERAERFKPILPGRHGP